ncbi:MAG: exodeoxyribonuclease III, partial [Gammaproteobacteria bacterium]|nr:exodeoxyribonuclease III [Gammaproteobacteria bacterium]
MRVVTLNCNGIRAASRKGFFDWLPTIDADVVCLQETKAQIDQLTDPLFSPEGYHCYYYDAEKKGYSGTALYSRVEPDKIHRGIGLDIADSEGRYLQADFGDLSVISLYLPSGSSGDERQVRKMRFLEFFMTHLRALARD